MRKVPQSDLPDALGAASPAFRAAESASSWGRSIAKPKEKIFEADPVRWIVAHRGTVDEAAASDTPLRLVWRGAGGQWTAIVEV